MHLSYAAPFICRAPGGFGVRAFSLLEVTVSMAILVGTIGAFFALSSRTMKLTRRAEEQALVCEAFTQRHEELRGLTWGAISLGTGIRTRIMDHKPEALKAVNMISEHWTVSAYPPDPEAPFTVNWNGASPATLSPSPVPAAYPDKLGLKLRWTLIWNARDTGEQRSVAFETVVARGGLHGIE